MKYQYSEADKKQMVKAAIAKNESRLQELINFASVCGFKKLGIACCAGVLPYAEKLSDVLVQAGFETCLAHCKQTKLQAAEISPEMSGITCDPLSQAEYLNMQKTDLNIIVGLCLGHELLFQKYAEAPLTTFLVKDFATGHKTIDNLK